MAPDCARPPLPRQGHPNILRTRSAALRAKHLGAPALFAEPLRPLRAALRRRGGTRRPTRPGPHPRTDEGPGGSTVDTTRLIIALHVVADVDLDEVAARDELDP